jgi:hypothetical protein
MTLSLEEKVLFIEWASYEELLLIAKEDEMGTFFSSSFLSELFIKRMRVLRGETIFPLHFEKNIV